MSERLGDIYYSRDFPVLAEIGRWEAAGRPGHALSPEEIANSIKKPVEQVVQSVGRLYHGGLVDAADASTFGGDDYMIRRLTGAGLQESGYGPDLLIWQRRSRTRLKEKFRRLRKPTPSVARSSRSCSRLSKR